MTELGVCPAATETRTDRMNNGQNGGRVCWAIAGTVCDGRVQGTCAHKLRDCLKCDFRVLVSSEQEDALETSGKVFQRLDETLKN